MVCLCVCVCVVQSAFPSEMFPRLGKRQSVAVQEEADAPDHVGSCAGDLLFLN